MKCRIAWLDDTTNVLLLAACATTIHILLNGQYGFHRDELDFILSARQLDWGYVSYPPMTPLFARIGLALFGESLRGVRVLPALAQAAVMVLAALMARDMGGGRSAQLLAALAVFIAPVSLMGGTVIMYFAFDYLWWAVVAFFTVRLLATDDPRCWLGIGAGIGLGALTKYTIAFWVAGLAVGVLATSARTSLRLKWPYLGAALALALALPNILWQAQHGFIVLEYLGAIHARDVAWGRADGFLQKQLYETTNPFSLPLWLAGLGACLFGVSLRRFRLLGWMFVATLALIFVSRGRSYYAAPAYVPLLAAGAVWFERWLTTRAESPRRRGLRALWGAQALGAVVGVVLIKPVAPISSPLWDITSRVNSEVVEMVGWQDLTAQVAEVYRSIPEGERPRSALLAGNYGEAGALDLYGDAYSLPPVISGANSLWYRGYGEPAPETVIVVGFDRGYAERFFATCRYAATVANRYGVRNEESTRHTGIYVCRDPRRPWSELWQDMRWFQ